MLKLKKAKKTLSYIIPMTNLAKYKTNWNNKKNLLDIPTYIPLSLESTPLYRVNGNINRDHSSIDHQRQFNGTIVTKAL